LVSVALSSNIPGFQESVCFIEPQPADVVEKMMQHLECVQLEASHLMREQLSQTISLLDELVNEGECNDRADEGHKKMRKTYRKLKEDVDLYVDQLPVISFNGNSYDVPQLSRYIIPLLNLDTDRHAHVVKRNSTYMCIITSTYRFIDALLFLSVGTSYDGFLKTYTDERDEGGDAPERKGHFPYEKVTSYDVLENGTFPSYDDFYSKLKNCNTLESSRLHFDQLLTEGLTRKEVLKKMELTSLPPTGREEYESLRRQWDAGGMTSLKDLMRAYNIQDVKPMTMAVASLWRFYMDLGVNILKECITVAGVARKLIFKAAREAGVGFSLIHPKDARLHDEILSKAIVGGPSLIFCRYQEAGKTFIRGDSGPVTRAVRGWDCNSLYLGALNEDMPVGPYIHRSAENSFRPEKRERYLISFIWLDWIARRENIALAHSLTEGREVMVLGCRVDGFHRETGRCFQFDGCFWHGCPCIRVAPDDEKKKKLLLERRQRTEMNRRRIEQDGRYKVVTMRECDFKKQMAGDVELFQFVQSWDPTFSSVKELRQEDMLSAIEDGTLFGVVCATVCLPTSWMGKFQHPLSPQELYEIFPPLFVNRLVSFDDVGAYTQGCLRQKQLGEKALVVVKRHSAKRKLDGAPVDRRKLFRELCQIKFVKPKPQRLLVSLLNCDRMVVTTPLLRWYIQHGMVVTVHEVLQYKAVRCFSKFVSMVTAARRAGNGSIKSKTMKVGDYDDDNIL
jgi:hypothetical protein